MVYFQSLLAMEPSTRIQQPGVYKNKFLIIVEPVLSIIKLQIYFLVNVNSAYSVGFTHKQAYYLHFPIKLISEKIAKH